MPRALRATIKATATLFGGLLLVALYIAILQGISVKFGFGWGLVAAVTPIVLCLWLFLYEHFS
jgi:hypothetical protein